ncbi:MAG: dTMP kinase [Rubrobacteraceae bacterium]
MSPRGTFITIEGLDFSGKSTLVEILKEMLEGSRPPTHFTREPGGTPAAEKIREILLDPEIEMDDWTEACLYAAARVDHARQEIAPRLERGENVICERYLDSSLAYQGVGRGLGLEAVRALNARAVEVAMPERTFYLKLNPEERERRARDRGCLDRLESVGEEFMNRVEGGFEELACREPDRIEVLDASLSPEELAKIARGFLEERRYTQGER